MAVDQNANTRQQHAPDADDAATDLQHLLRRADDLRERDHDREALLLYRRAVELGPDSFRA